MCIHLCAHIYIQSFTYTFIYSYKYMHKYIAICLFNNNNNYIYIYMHVYIYVCLCVPRRRRASWWPAHTRAGIRAFFHQPGHMFRRRELSPGLPRDRQKYQPLYYSGLVIITRSSCRMHHVHASLCTHLHIIIHIHIYIYI